jgi:hypothetical protein
MGKWGRSSGVAGVQELQNAEGSVMVVVVVVAKKDPVGKPPQSSSSSISLIRSIAFDRPVWSSPIPPGVEAGVGR